MTPFEDIRAVMHRDLWQIFCACPDIEGVYAIAYYQGGMWATLALCDTVAAGIELHDGSPRRPDLSVMSIIENPRTRPQLWKRLPDHLTSQPQTDVEPFIPWGYFIIRKDDGRCGLALSGLQNDGRIRWSGNEELIDEFSKLLAKRVRRKDRQMPQD
jgi:hypothetical protein